DTGLRLAKFFGTSDGFWLGLQVDYDSAVARDVIADALSKIQPWPSNQALAG
ncbi:MAG: addiction module antidote protein, HigA family, partial [Deltaproteobacteria bacterium]|nr:addiction module antidote protein, HigA family [Deltaproteobacteria bacterium]